MHDQQTRSPSLFASVGRVEDQGQIGAQVLQDDHSEKQRALNEARSVSCRRLVMQPQGRAERLMSSKLNYVLYRFRLHPRHLSRPSRKKSVDVRHQ